MSHFRESFWKKKKKETKKIESEKAEKNIQSNSESSSVYRTMNHLAQAFDLIKEFLNIWTCYYLYLLFFYFSGVLSAAFNGLE